VLNRSLTMLACIAAVVAMPSTARAAVVSGPGYHPVFTAAAGESNNLRVSVLADGVTTYFDDDVPVTTTSPDCGAALGNVTCSPVAPSLYGVTIDLRDEDDQTTVTGVTGSATESGGDGNDHLRANPGFGTLNGGAGNDILDAGAGDSGRSTLNGEAGDDVLTASPSPGFFTEMDGGTGSDTFVGGTGGSSLDYSARGTPVTVTIDGAANDGEAGEGDNVGSHLGSITGGRASDTLSGGGDDDHIIGGPGDDRLTGADGSDWLEGEEGDDTISGGAGDDSFEGGAGADDLTGGDGEDYAFEYAVPSSVPTNLNVTLDDVANDGHGGEGDNVHSDIEDLDTWSGDDMIVGSSAANVIDGTAGNDTIDGAGGEDFIYGSGGNDTIRARDGFNDLVDCGSGSDVVVVDSIDMVSETCESVDRAPAPPAPPPAPVPPPPPADSDGDGTPDTSDPCPTQDARPRDENRNGCLDLRLLTGTYTLTPARYVKLSRDGRRYLSLGVTVRDLVAKGLPSGARVRLTCTRDACNSHTVTVGRGGSVRLVKFLRSRRLRTGTRLVLRATLDGYVGVGASYTIRANAVSKRQFCVRPDGRSGGCSTLRGHPRGAAAANQP
jgi:Ca2+-binding RTX toxin-like protein